MGFITQEEKEFLDSIYRQQDVSDEDHERRCAIAKRLWVGPNDGLNLRQVGEVMGVSKQTAKVWSAGQRLCAMHNGTLERLTDSEWRRMPEEVDELYNRWKHAFVFWYNCGESPSMIAKRFDIPEARLVTHFTNVGCKWSIPHNKNRRLRAIEILGGECAVCGEDDYDMLQIDHISPNRGSESGNRAITNILRGDTVNYQCLCANHNWKKRKMNRETGWKTRNDNKSLTCPKCGGLKGRLSRRCRDCWDKERKALTPRERELVLLMGEKKRKNKEYAKLMGTNESNIIQLRRGVYKKMNVSNYSSFKKEFDKLNRQPEVGEPFYGLLDK